MSASAIRDPLSCAVVPMEIEHRPQPCDTTPITHAGLNARIECVRKRMPIHHPQADSKGFWTDLQLTSRSFLAQFPFIPASATVRPVPAMTEQPSVRFFTQLPTKTELPTELALKIAQLLPIADLERFRKTDTTLCIIGSFALIERVRDLRDAVNSNEDFRNTFSNFFPPLPQGNISYKQAVEINKRILTTVQSMLKNLPLEYMPEELKDLPKELVERLPSVYIPHIRDACDPDLLTTLLKTVYDYSLVRFYSTCNDLDLTGSLDEQVVMVKKRVIEPNIGWVRSLIFTQSVTFPLHCLHSEFCRLSNLTRLSLKATMLTHLSECVGRLSGLRVLDVSCNEIQYLPDVFGCFPHLENLDLCMNILEQLPVSIGALPALTNLNIGSNYIRELPTSMGSCQQLAEFNASNNKLEQLPDFIGDLRTLTKLDLSRNRIKELPDSIGSLPVLQNFLLMDNDLEQLPVAFGELSRLNVLLLSRNKLKDLPPSFGRLESLMQLNLSQNQIKKLPEWFSSLSALKNLNLIHNELEDVSPINFMSTLTTLEISFNKFLHPKRVLAQLQKDLPKTNVKLTILPSPWSLSRYFV